MRLKKFFVFILCFYFLLLFSGLSFASPSPLPAEEVFHLSIENSKTDSILLTWKIKSGYYLYQNRFSFKLTDNNNVLLGHYQMPPGIQKNDAYIGRHIVYEKTTTIALPIANPEQKNYVLQVGYQGCAHWGFCYPPITQLILYHAKTSKFEFLDHKPNHSLSLTELLTQQSAVEDLLKTAPLLSVAIFFVLGLLLSFTPCVLPMIPILSSLILKQGSRTNTKKAFLLSLTYVLSMAMTLALIGLVMSLVGKNLQINMQNVWIIIFFALLFMLLGFSMLGFFELSLPNSLQLKLNQYLQKQQGGDYLSVALMGILATLILSPCVTPPLVGTLAYISQQGQPIWGGIALFTLGLGMGVPLLLVGCSLQHWLPKTGAWMVLIKSLLGYFLLTIAIWLLSRVLSMPYILALTACLCLILVWQALQNRHYFSGRKPIYLVYIFFTITLLAYAISLITGAVMGNTSLLKPLSKPQEKPLFQATKTFNDLEQQLKLAKATHRKTILDFYADWCASCVVMEHTVFSDPEVQQSLKGYFLLRVDMTNMNAEIQTIQNRLNVIAPPTLLLFDENGKELKQKRIIGEASKEKILNSLLD